MNYLFEQSGKPDPNYATMKHIIGFIMFLDGAGVAAESKMQLVIMYFFGFYLTILCLKMQNLTLGIINVIKVVKSAHFICCSLRS